MTLSPDEIDAIAAAVHRKKLTAAEIKALAAALAPLVAQELQKMTSQSDAQLEMQHFMSRPRAERKKIQQEKMRKAKAELQKAQQRE